MFRSQGPWSVVVAVATTTMMVFETVLSSSIASCDCSAVSCSQKVNTSCSVTKVPTCGGYYVRQLPDGPALFKAGGAQGLNVTQLVTSAGGQNVSLTVMWTEPSGQGSPVAQYEVALEGYNNDGARLGFQSYYIVPSPGQAPEHPDSVSVHMTCSCSYVISALKVFVTSVLGPSDDCNLRQTTAVISLDGTQSRSIIYTPDEPSAETPGFLDGSFTVAGLSDTNAKAVVKEITCPAAGGIQLRPSTIQPEVLDGEVVHVKHQAICQPYELRVDFSSELEKVLVYILPNASGSSTTTEKRQKGLAVLPSSSPLSSTASKPFSLPLQHAAPSAQPSQLTSGNTVVGTSRISSREVRPTSGAIGSLAAERAQTSSSVNSTSDSANVAKLTTDENVHGNMSDITEMNVTTSISHNQSTGSPVTGDKTTNNQSTYSPGSGGTDETFDLIITVAVVGALVVAACIALFLALRQLYRRATIKHEFKPVRESSSRHMYSDPVADKTSQTSFEMESRLDRQDHSTASPSLFVTFTSASKDVLIIYHGGDERHVRNVKVFKHDLQRHLGSDVSVRDAVLSDVIHQMLLPPKDGPGTMKLILVLSAGIRDILTGPHPEQLKQFLYEVVQSTPHYYVIFVTRDTMSRDDVKYFTAIFAEVERTFEITGSGCSQFHALTEEILKDGFEPPLSFSDFSSVDIQCHFHKLNEANDNRSEPPRSLYHGMA